MQRCADHIRGRQSVKGYLSGPTWERPRLVNYYPNHKQSPTGLCTHQRRATSSSHERPIHLAYFIQLQETRLLQALSRGHANCILVFRWLTVSSPEVSDRGGRHSVIVLCVCHPRYCGSIFEKLLTCRDLTDHKCNTACESDMSSQIMGTTT